MSRRTPDAGPVRVDPTTLEMRALREQQFPASPQPKPPRGLSVPDYDHLRLHRGVLWTPTGGIPVKQIGKGFFSVIYREVGGAGRVFALASDDTYDKEIAASAREHRAGNPHIPQVERFGATVDRTVYVMPYYSTPLRKGASPEGWRDYTLIKECHEQARRQRLRRGQYGPYEMGYPVTYDTVECAREAQVRPQVVEALEALMSEASNYGATYASEFSPRNLATDDAGNLVLLDVMYDAESVARKRTAKSKRMW